MTSPKFRDTDHHFICVSNIVFISSLRLVSKLLFAVAVLFHSTNIKKLITNTKKLICGVTVWHCDKVWFIALLFSNQYWSMYYWYIADAISRNCSSLIHCPILQKIKQQINIKNDNFQAKKLFFHFGLSLKRRQHFQLSLHFKRVALENGPTLC